MEGSEIRPPEENQRLLTLVQNEMFALLGKIDLIARVSGGRWVLLMPGEEPIMGDSHMEVITLALLRGVPVKAPAEGSAT